MLNLKKTAAHFFQFLAQGRNYPSRFYNLSVQRIYKTSKHSSKFAALMLHCSLYNSILYITKLAILGMQQLNITIFYTECRIIYRECRIQIHQ